MEIGNLNNRTYYNFQTRATAKSSSIFSSHMETQEDTVEEDPLNYYRKLCEEFPNITFRLGDRETLLKDTSKIYFGYNDSMNQVGDNFGCMGQCSIEIDISVIRRMQSDPEYVIRVKSMLKSIERMYPEFESYTRDSGMRYTLVNLYDEGGDLHQLITRSRQRPSTEEELRQMHNMDGSAEQIQRLFTQMQMEAIDRFLEMTDTSEKKS